MLSPCKLSKEDAMSSTRRGKDLISQLPDELLYIVISYLGLKDVVKSSTLSHRWKHVCASIPALKFICPNMRSNDDDPCSKEQMFVKSVNRFLQVYEGPNLSLFKIVCCLGREHADSIDEWVRFAVGKGTHKLFLKLCCKKGCIPRTENKYVLRSRVFEDVKSNLNHLSLASCALCPNFSYRFNRLETLCLISLQLSHYDLHGLLSCFEKLKKLILNECTLPTKLCLGQLRVLEKFIVRRPIGLREIVMSNMNLLYLRCLCPEIMFDLSGAPNIANLSCYVSRDKLKYAFTNLPKQLPMLRSLTVFCNFNWAKRIPKTISTFSQATDLFLILLNHTLAQFSIVRIISILRAFPNLRTFNLEMHGLEDFEKESVNPRKYAPEHLEEVFIGGFCGTPNQMKFVICLLKNAASLNRLVIRPLKSRKLSPMRQSWVEVKEQLQEFAKDGVLVIQ